MAQKLVFLILRESELRRDLIKSAFVISRADLERGMARAKTFYTADTEAAQSAVLDRMLDPLNPDQNRRITFDEGDT